MWKLELKDDLIDRWIEWLNLVVLEDNYGLRKLSLWSILRTWIKNWTTEQRYSKILRRNNRNCQIEWNIEGKEKRID